MSIGQGLTSAEARRRLERDGSNELKAEPSAPGWRHFVAQFQDPLVYLLLLAVVVTLVVWGMEGATGWPVDGLVILTIVCLNASLGFWQETRSRKAAEALAKLTAVTSAVRRDGQVLRVPSSELVSGDILLLAEGDHVGADARLLEANSLRVQEASLTGESEAVQCVQRPLRDSQRISRAV